MKICADCKFNFLDGQYRRCKKCLDGKQLCGEMRVSPCGPEAVYYEKKR